MTDGTERLPPEQNGWRNRLDDEKEQYLDWLTPTMKADYIACEVDGKTRAERASERGVEPATVSASISRAKERLQEIAEDEGSIQTDGGCNARSEDTESSQEVQHD